MRIKEVIAKNFLSFKDLSYKLDSHPVLIQGENLTEDSQESNGSGKSSLSAAIEYCLFKQTSKKEVDAKLIHFGEEKAELKLFIERDIRGEILEIQREIKLKGSSTVSLFTLRNGVKTEVEVATVNDANDYIINWIGISKEDLMNYFIINKERYKSFFSSSNREKIEMINRFSNAKLIEGVNKFVEEDIDSLNQKLNKLIVSKNNSLTKIKVIHGNMLEEVMRDIDREIRIEVDGLETRIGELQEVIVEQKQAIGDLEDSIQLKLNKIKANNIEIEVVKTQLNKSDSGMEELDAKIAEFYEAKQKLNKEAEKIDSEKSVSEANRLKVLRNKRELESILADIEKNLAGTISCPKCSHKFILSDPDLNVEEELVAKEDTVQLIGMTGISLDSVMIELDKFATKEAEISRSKSQIRVNEISVEERRKGIMLAVRSKEEEIRLLNKRNTELNTEIDNVNSSINRIKNDIINLDESIERCKTGILLAKERKIDRVRIKAWRTQMLDEAKVLKETNKAIKEVKKEQFEVSQWIYNFKKFNMYLANQSLKVIQGYCNKFLQDIKSDIQVRWEGMKMLADGSLREEITPYIIRDNMQRSFWGYSGGERARLDYSMIFTLQEMINKTNKWGGLQFLSTDEIAEGIDSLGLSDLMKSLSGMNKSVLITTHVINRNIGSNILLIKKVNGVSEICKN